MNTVYVIMIIVEHEDHFSNESFGISKSLD